MTATQPPQNYEDLIRLIHEQHDQMSKTYKQIAVYLIQEPNEVAIQSMYCIANRCGLHASNFVRFAQSLGFKGFKGLQLLFQKRLLTAAPGFEARTKTLEEELQTREDRSEINFLRDLLIKDVASLQSLLEDIAADDMAAAVNLLHGAETVYLVGQLRSSPVVELSRYMLTMLGKRCILLDASGGFATYMARTMTPKDVLLAVSFRFYAKEVISIVDEAGAKGIPIVVISDSTLSPLAKSAKILFSVPERDHIFSRSLAAPMCLAQALAVGVAARLQDDGSRPRIPTVTHS